MSVFTGAVHSFSGLFHKKEVVSDLFLIAADTLFTASLIHGIRPGPFLSLRGTPG